MSIKPQLNIDDLYETKKKNDLNKLELFNKLLVKIHTKIKTASRQRNSDNFCSFVMPEILVGFPNYNLSECLVFVVDSLETNGFLTRYIHPNLLFISWKHWVPTYVRTEIKKKTGNVVDEYGNIINNDDKNTDNTSAFNTENKDNILFSNKQIKNINNSSNAKEKEYKDVKSYKPSGNLIYNNNLLEKLQIN